MTVGTVRRDTAWTWQGITHPLSSQQDQSGSENSVKDIAGSGMESLTFCQVNRIRQCRYQIVRRDTAGPAMESLTPCQANKTRVVVRTVRRDTAGPAMELLTPCQANRTRVAVRTVRRDGAEPAHDGITHFLSRGLERQ